MCDTSWTGKCDLPEFTDLAALLASRCGIEPGAKSAGFMELDGKIARSDILVFVLIDGLGEAMLERLGTGSFLARHHRASLMSVFPSTTACAMTSLASRLAPSEHGIPGRYMHLREERLDVNSLAFRTRFDNSPLIGIASERIWPFPSLIPRMQAETFSVIPKSLVGSPFAAYLCGKSPVAGYASIPDAVDSILLAARDARKRSFLFLYVWDLDSKLHDLGPQHDQSLSLLLSIDAEMERLSEGLGKRSGLVISADHGQIDVDEKNRRLLHPGHPLMDSLLAIPFGEPRAAQFLVKPGREEVFRRDFERFFGDSFSLLRMNSAEALSLFGGESYSPFALRNFGDYLAVAKGRDLLVYEDAAHGSALHIGEHGGNLPEERIIPLIIG